jgi:Na+/proline symporter
MGGRRFGRLLMVAQAFGAGTRTDQVVAVVGASAQVGLAGIWYQWLYLFSTPFFWIISPVYRRLRYITIGDFFEKRYSPSIGAVYAIVGLLYFSVNIGIILKGTGVTIEAVTGGAIHMEWAVIGMMLFFLFYGLLGGLVAAAVTQYIQGLFILVLSFLLIPFALHAAGGAGSVRNALPDDWFRLIATEEVTLFFITMAVINALVGIVVQPHHMAINGSGKDEISCRSGWTYGTFIKRAATLGWAFTGAIVVVLFPQLTTASGAEREMAFGMAILELLPQGFVGIMIAAMVAAVVAACNNFMVNGSALFTRNFYQRYINRNATEKHYLAMARVGSVLVVALGVIIALVIPSVVQGLLLIWKIMAFMGIAFWMAIIWRRSNTWGAWVSVLVTISISVYTESIGWSFPEQVALYLPMGLLSFVIASLLTPPEPENKLNAFYSLLNTPVGSEERLVNTGIDVINEPGMDSSRTRATNSNWSIPLLDDKPAADRGERLMLVHLLKIGKVFNYKQFKIDLDGFLVGWVLVGAYILVAWLLTELMMRV